MEVITQRDDLVIRRLVLAPGEAMPWHTDTCHRFTVIVRADQLAIEYRDSGEEIQVPVQPGTTAWDEPDTRIHRGINTGATLSAEVVTFYFKSRKVDPQPEHAQRG